MVELPHQARLGAQAVQEVYKIRDRLELDIQVMELLRHGVLWGVSIMESPNPF
jgi:hypothetical protein